jgi:hypothetical protein
VIFPTSQLTLAAALTGLVLGCTANSAQTGGADDGVLTCSAEITSRGGMLTVEGVVVAEEAVAGTYDLSVTRRGAALTQGGTFSLRAGETGRLGRVTMNGPAAGLDAELTLSVDGKTTRCPVAL